MLSHLKDTCRDNVVDRCDSLGKVLRIRILGETILSIRIFLIFFFFFMSFAICTAQDAVSVERSKEVTSWVSGAKMVTVFHTSPGSYMLVGQIWPTVFCVNKVLLEHSKFVCILSGNNRKVESLH